MGLFFHSAPDPTPGTSKLINCELLPPRAVPRLLQVLPGPPRRSRSHAAGGRRVTRGWEGAGILVAAEHREGVGVVWDGLFGENCLAARTGGGE